MSEIVVLLHGVLMRSPSMWLVAKHLRARGFHTLQFDYGSLWREPSVAMESLAMKLYSLDSPVHLVGHSLGGLIALETLNRYQQLPSGRVVCLGTPLAGSITARALAEKKMRFMTGRSGPLLRGGLIQLPPHREVGVIAGAKPRGAGKLVASFDGIYDGTVAVWETRLPGLKDHLILPLSHAGLVMSAQASNFTANFLETGYFQA
jgi:pimeloyl-ACP methyl ester carboxylesterase